MAVMDNREPRAVLDQAIHGKALAAEFFEFLGRSVPGVKLRQAFQRFARDEREQRKILMKYRKDLYGGGDSKGFQHEGGGLGLHVDGEITARSDLLRALHVAIRSEERATRFYTEAALNFSDRHAKIFFRILAESGRGRLAQLDSLRVAIDRDGMLCGTVEPLQMQTTGS
jgi:rubrerythrin